MVMKKRGRPEKVIESNFEEIEKIDVQILQESEIVEIQIPQEEKVQKKYLLCPFCQTKQYERIGRDETSSWCVFCGRCFMAIWKEEE